VQIEPFAEANSPEPHSEILPIHLPCYCYCCSWSSQSLSSGSAATSIFAASYLWGRLVCRFYRLPSHSTSRILTRNKPAKPQKLQQTSIRTGLGGLRNQLLSDPLILLNTLDDAYDEEFWPQRVRNMCLWRLQLACVSFVVALVVGRGRARSVKQRCARTQPRVSCPNNSISQR